ncbi:arsenate reductase ArsC [Parvularcula sp. IMCC14364]|uniref:arsenate reductase ArsC n=1 Tax=Parvularcula sp. IMCC14364 TaxID=3067902 RepID=UPI002740420A|nr:arsenate reductase ArsC [Parvularcula sp. IMCC14364]
MKNMLFLCTGNSARSVLSECWLNHVGGDKWRGFSAGSHPTGTPNPYALKTLEKHDIAAVAGEGGPVRSKSWDEFALPDAPLMDVVVTVCDNAAGEVCPVWPVRAGGAPPVKLHWAYPDPAAVPGSDEEILAAFEEVFKDIRERIGTYVSEH